MRRDEAFVDVLDRELRLAARQPEPRASAAWQTRRTASPSPFLFGTNPSLAGGTGTVRPVNASPPPAGRPRFASEPRARVAAPQRSQPARLLSGREQRALGGLRALGAELNDDFTAGELRRAFRLLARRFHPDSHPHTGAAAKAGLSRTFAELAEHHRCLLAVLEPLKDIRH